MPSPPRLERLRRLVQSDLAALPHRPTRPIQSACSGDQDSDSSGGITLEQQQPPENSKATGPEARLKAVPNISLDNQDRRFVLMKNVASSYNLKTPPRTAKLAPLTHLQQGDLVSARQHFSPIIAIAKFPYLYCNKTHSQAIASAFFDKGKFWEREWDLYYIWDEEPIKPLVVVLESQVQDLLQEINHHLDLELKITDAQREGGLVSRFPDHPQCLPRYLGRSRSREEYENMVKAAPDKSFRPAGEPVVAPPDGGTLEQFKQLMEELWDVQRAKTKASKEKRQQDRLGKQKSMADHFKRAQRYLGLRARETSDKSFVGPPTAIDPSLPVPFDFDQSVVFVCVDVESWERAHHKITEVGIATLDTRDLVGIAPGLNGEAWRSRIKARHFRIKEHRHLVNSQFVQGHPDGFDYGESTFVSLKEAPAHVAACFQPPFGVHSSNTPAEDIVTLLRDIDPNEKRKIIFLGHDTRGDIRYLQQLGYDPLKVENIVEAMDTVVLYRVWRREQQATSLGKILHDFDIAGWKLHNAGNDAMFTVQAMLAICVREATIRGSPELETMRKEEKATRLAAAHENARQRAKDDAEGWSDNERSGDGGAPSPLHYNW